MARKRRHKTPLAEDLSRLELCWWATLADDYYSPEEVGARANCKALVDGRFDADAYLSFESLFGRQ